MTMVNVTYKGEAYELDLDVGELTPDQRVREMVAEAFNVQPNTFQTFTVNRETTGQYTLVPAAVHGTEEDTRLAILRSLTNVPHGQLDATLALHRQAIEDDPYFYACLATWLTQNSKVRDHVTASTMNLVFANEDWLREVGLGLLNRLNVRQVAQIVRQLGTTTRSLRTEIRHYLQRLESNPERWDSQVVMHRDNMKYLYVASRYNSEMAQNVLFDGLYFDGDAPFEYAQKSAAVWLASQTEDMLERATIVAQYNIPFLVATSLLTDRSPAVWAALIDATTPQQLMNNLKSLEQAGVMENRELAQMVNQKIRSGRNINTGRAKEATKHLKNQDLIEAVDEGRTRAVRQNPITKSTALFVDISSSMHDAIELAKQVAPMIATQCTGDFIINCFNSHVYPIRSTGTNIADYEREFNRLRVSGMTSFGASIDSLQIPVEQFVYICDQEETTRPRFGDAYQRYVQRWNVEPNVVVINVGRVRYDIRRQAQQLGIPFQEWDFNGDYNSLDQINRLLSGKTRNEMDLELIDEILQTPLPQRIMHQ